MSKTELKLLAVVVAFFLCVFFLVNRVSTAVDEAGGLKGVAVSAGKWVKDVSAEIEAHDHRQKGEFEQ